MTLIGNEVFGFWAGAPALLAACILYMIPVAKRKWFGWRLLFSVLVSGIIFTGMGQMLKRGSGFPILVYFSLFALMAGIFWLCCRIQFREAVYCSACAYLTQHMVYSFLMLDAACRSGQISERTDAYGIIFVIGMNDMVYLIGYILIFFLVVRNLPQEGRFYVSSFHSMTLLVFTVAGSIILSHLSTITAVEQGDNQMFALCRRYDFLCCVIALWAQYGKSQELKIQKKMMTELELRRQQIKQYENYQENLELINYKCHDLKQQVAALRDTNDRQMPKEVLSKVEESVMIYDSYVKTGNEALDTILTERNLWCEKNGITMSCIVDGQCLAFMDTIDLFAIFGNALTNAIESVSKITEREKRVISTRVFERMDVVYMQFENYYESEIIRNGLLPESTKSQDGNHGYGLKSIRYSVKKYNGTMIIDTESNLFNLQIAIPKPIPE